MMKEEESRFVMPVGKPIISSRLPKAFSQPKHLTQKKTHDHHDLTAVNEFKNVKKLLSPLKQSSPTSSALRKVIHKLACFPSISSNSPSNSLHSEMLVQSIVRLEEMITLSILKSSYRSGIVRKSLHAPTLKLYASKEVPVSTFSIRKKLLDTLKSWQSIQKNARHLIEVNSSFWNSPEGCVTIIMEYMAGDSLGKLCESIGAIPEKILRSTSIRILSALSYFHKKIGAHGGVDMYHIMFTRLGKAKLGLALTSRLNLKEDTKKLSTIEEDVFDFGSTLLAASIGGLEWANEYVGLGGECCLLHTAMICSEMPYLNKLSASYCDFLCRATRYNKDARANINDLISHEWLKSDECVGADVSIQELLGMSTSSGNNTDTVGKQIKILMESLQVVLTGYSEPKPFSQTNIKELAVEFGIHTETLQKELRMITKT